MPRRMKGDGTVYKRADGLWVGMLDLGFVNGKRKRRAVYGKTQREAADKLDAARELKKQNRLTTSATLTLGTYLTTWLDRLEQDEVVTPSTLAGYRSKMAYVIKVAGRRRLDRLEVEHIREVYRHLAPDHAHSYLVQTHRILSKAMKDAYVEDVVSSNIMTKVTTPKGGAEAKETRALTLPELIAIGHASRGDRLQSRWATQITLGMRQGEVIGLGWEDVDLDLGTLTVRRALQRQKGGLTFVKPKSKMSGRTLFLPPDLLAAMRTRYAEWLTEEHPDLSHLGKLAPSALVWGQVNGKPRDDKQDRNAWYELLERAGVTKAGTHSARHGVATLLSELGEPAKVAQAMLGHADPNLTIRVYTHADDAAKLRAATKIESAISPREA